MTLKSTIQSDITNIFLDSDSSPQSVSAVYTPVGGIAQAAVQVLFNNFPMHGDEQQVLPVEQEAITALAKASDVSAWKLNGKITINSVDYELINDPYPTTSSNYWSVLDLRLPTNNKTRI